MSENLKVIEELRNEVSHLREVIKEHEIRERMRVRNK